MQQRTADVESVRAVVTGVRVACVTSVANMARVRVVSRMVAMSRVAAVAGVTVTAVSMSGPVSVPTSVAGAYALERHGHEAGCSQEQQKCVQIHFMIEPFVGRWALHVRSMVRVGPSRRYT